jgi:hypothetical protein
MRQIVWTACQSSRLRCFSAVAFLLAASFLLVESYTAAQPAVGDRASAAWSEGVLRLTIPYRDLRAGAGVLTVEVLNPEDEVLGRAEQHVEMHDSQGVWHQDVRLTQAVPFDDLVWQRVRYRFAYAGRSEPALTGTESISEILRRPVVHVLGQRSYLAGGAAAIRVIATDAQDETVAGPGNLRIELTPPDQPPRFTGPLNERGTAEAQFRFPAGLAGMYPLRYTVDTAIGSAEYVQQVQLQDKVSILLTTEKPIYQPGQTIHIRALALDRANHAAPAPHPLTFEVEDSRGNKVFKRATRTDEFGIASAEFALADEVNLGTYHLRAVLDPAASGSANSAEIALSVQRYMLPKFKVAPNSRRRTARRSTATGPATT